jgi:hypothetical protein
MAGRRARKVSGAGGAQQILNTGRTAEQAILGQSRGQRSG